MDYIAINAVSKITGLSTFTIRNWEKRYSWFPSGNRSASNTRYYTNDDLSVMIRAKQLRDSGKSLGSIQSRSHLMALVPEKPHQSGIVADNITIGALKALSRISILDFNKVLLKAEKDFSPTQMIQLVLIPLVEQLIQLSMSSEEGAFVGKFSSHAIKAKLFEYYYLSVNKRTLTVEPNSPGCMIGTTMTEHNELILLLVFAHLINHCPDIIYLGVNLLPGSLKKFSVGANVSEYKVIVPFSQRQNLTYSQTYLMSFSRQLMVPLFFDYIGTPLDFHMVDGYKKASFGEKIRHFVAAKSV